MPKQAQLFPATRFIPVFRNSDYLGGEFNAELVMDYRTRNFIGGGDGGPDLEQFNCTKAANDRFAQLNDIFERSIQAANDARAAAIQELLIRLLLELSGADLWLAIEEIIKELWSNTNGYVLAAGGLGVGGIDWDELGPADYPGGKLPPWRGGTSTYPDAPTPGTIPIDEPPQAPQPGKPLKPPSPPRDPSKLGQWLKDNWRKIIGRLPIQDLWGLILKALRKIAPWLVAAIIAAYAIEFELLDQIFREELDRINRDKQKANRWLAIALACCMRAAECGSRGNGCVTSFTPGVPEQEWEQPDDGCGRTV